MTTLARGISATATILDVSDEALNVARPFLATLDSETIRVRGLEYVSGAATRWNVDRGIDSTPATHAGGATVTLGDGGVGGAAEAGTVVVTPPLEVDVSAALEGANAPDGSNPLATIADLTIAEVLSNGNTVADNQQILVPDGAQFDITGLTSPSPGIGWLPDGSLTMGSGTATIVFGADGVIMISAGNGGILTLDPDGSYSLLNGSSGLAVAADGKITLAMQGIGDVLAISATGDVEVNGSGVVKLNLPTAPGAAGELWADSGIVTVA